jgi:putative ATPase
MKEAQYGVGYRYPHDLEGGVDSEHVGYLPDALERRRRSDPSWEPIVQPSDRGWEGRAAAELAARRQVHAAPAASAEPVSSTTADEPSDAR